MLRIAFIDLDGILIDNTEREAQAILAARNCFNLPDGVPSISFPSIRFPQAWNDVFYSDLALYNPEFIKLDTLQEDAVASLDALTKQGYFTFFLTSRPDTPELRKATETWLQDHGFQLGIPLGIPGHDALIMKPLAVSENRIFTKVWKALTVQMFTAVYEADEVVVIDDDVRNLEEIKKYKMRCECKVFQSFKDCSILTTH